MSSFTLYLRQEWHALWDCQPGERFERRYQRTRREQAQDEVVPRLFRVVLALVIFAVGIGMMFLPLPGIPFLVMSTALLATESLSLARLLDRSELRLQRGWKSLKLRLGLSPLAARALTVIFIFSPLALSSGCCYYAFLR